jgi:hypothetical protein
MELWNTSETTESILDFSVGLGIRTEGVLYSSLCQGRIFCRFENPQHQKAKQPTLKRAEFSELELQF